MLVKFEGFAFVDGGVTASKGFQAAGLHCGIRANKTKKDLGLIAANKPAVSAAVYTRNKVKGAPLSVTKDHLKNGKSQAVIVNSGIANTCNADGIEKAQMMCHIAANELNMNSDDIIVASTGVIGQPLPIEPIEKAMPELTKALAINGNEDFAEAIMTTDTFKKEVAVEFILGDVKCRIGGCAKGSGMIHPNMATMLCFLTSDVSIAPELLQIALKQVVDETFNMVSIDGDTSTNDMVSIMASGEAKNPTIVSQDENFEMFVNGLYVVLMNLSRMIAKDGEGATKLLECIVSGAVDKNQAKTVAKSVITSSLFKAAMFGADANWGRVLCAIGYADCEVDVYKINVSFASKCGILAVCENGAGIDFSEEIAKEVLSADEIKIMINLNSGEETAVAWGCDLTYDYVKINGDYRT